MSGTSATSASGTCTKKIDLQPSSSVRMPPAPGPNAAPRMPAATQTRAARGRLPVVSARRSSAATTTNAAPTAWTQRAATSSSNDPASPQASDAAAKTRAPATNAGRGRRRATNAAGTATSASTRLKEVRTQATVVIPTSKRPRISGSASVTIEESASASPTERPSSPERMRASRRVGYPPGGAVLGRPGRDLRARVRELGVVERRRCIRELLPASRDRASRRPKGRCP